MKDFNIPDVVENINNLREIWIEAVEQVHDQEMTVHLASTNDKSKSQSGFSTNLHNEMVGELPLKLKTITISGPGFTQLADNVFSVRQH